MTEVSETVEGFKPIKFESNGRIFYQAPELNMFTLVTLVKCQFDAAATCGTWYSNIVLAEPPAGYFSPSPDTPITALKQPGGIIWKQPPR